MISLFKSKANRCADIVAQWCRNILSQNMKQKEQWYGKREYHIDRVSSPQSLLVVPLTDDVNGGGNNDAATLTVKER